MPTNALEHLSSRAFVTEGANVATTCAWKPDETVYTMDAQQEKMLRDAMNAIPDASGITYDGEEGVRFKKPVEDVIGHSRNQICNDGR